MHLYLLKQHVDLDYGKGVANANLGFVIRAASKAQARYFADQRARGEGRIWQDEELTTCERLMETGEPGIILADFDAN